MFHIFKIYISHLSLPTSNITVILMCDILTKISQYLSLLLGEYQKVIFSQVNIYISDIFLGEYQK